MQTKWNNKHAYDLPAAGASSSAIIMVACVRVRRANLFWTRGDPPVGCLKFVANLSSAPAPYGSAAITSYLKVVAGRSGPERGERRGCRAVVCVVAIFVVVVACVGVCARLWRRAMRVSVGSGDGLVERRAVERRRDAA